MTHDALARPVDQPIATPPVEFRSRLLTAAVRKSQGTARRRRRYRNMSDTPIRYSAPSSTESAGGMRRRSSWWQRLHRVWNSLARDNISIMAAGIAYYAMLSIFPGMSALVLTYGLVADPLAIEAHVSALADVL